MGDWVMRALGALALALLLAAPAVATGPVEQVVQVVFHPDDPDVLILRYMNKGEGLFFSDDGGQSWRMTCGDFALAQLPSDAPGGRYRVSEVVLTADGALYGASADYLWQTDAGGCSWDRVAEQDGVWLSDLALHPGDPNVVLAAMGEPGDANTMLERRADGSFAALGVADDAQIFHLGLVETAAGLRIYQSGIRGTVPIELEGMTFDGPRYVIRVSDDGGETFEAHVQGDGSEPLKLMAVDPSDPDRIVVLRSSIADGDELLISTDGGASLSSYLALSKLRDILVTADGRVMIAEAPESESPTTSAGVWFADSLAEAPAKISEDETFCVGHQEATDTFFACPGKEFGRIDPSDGAFTSMFEFTQVDGFVDCDQDVGAMCEDQLCSAFCGPGHFYTAAVCAGYEGPLCGPCVAVLNTGEACPVAGVADGGVVDGGVGAADGGVADGGVADGGGASDSGAAPEDAGGGSGSRSGDGCACRGAGGSDDDGGDAALVVAALVLGVLRRRRGDRG